MPMCASINLEHHILWEDSRFIILNKPSGMAVHGVQKHRLGVIETMRKLRPDAPYLELAHRLDKSTSGCLVIAKRKSALRAFQKQQISRGVDKHYLALVKGVWQGEHQKVDKPLLKTTAKNGVWSVKVDAKGKHAVSYFSPVERYENSTLMRIKIITGRTHQIRVHAACIGFPIAGDEQYGDIAFNQHMKNKGLNRLYLHAASIKFSLENLADYHVHAPLDALAKL